MWCSAQLVIALLVARKEACTRADPSLPNPSVPGPCAANRANTGSRCCPGLRPRPAWHRSDPPSACTKMCGSRGDLAWQWLCQSTGRNGPFPRLGTRFRCMQVRMVYWQASTCDIFGVEVQKVDRVAEEPN